MDLVPRLGVVGDGGDVPVLRDVPRAAELDVPAGFRSRSLRTDAVAPAVLVREGVAVELAPAQEDLRVLDGTVVERGFARGKVVRVVALRRDGVSVPVALEADAEEDGERIEDPELLVGERAGGPAVGLVAFLRVDAELGILVVRLAVQKVVLELAAEEELVLEVEDVRRAGVLGREAEVPEVGFVVAQVRETGVGVVVRVMRVALGEGEDGVDLVLVVDDAASREVDAVGREMRA